MTVKWLRLALADLDEIYEFIAKQNPEAASRIISQIWQSAKLLGQHPGMGRAGRVTGTRELVIHNSNYIIPYRAFETELQILRVLHTARLWPDSF